MAELASSMSGFLLPNNFQPLDPDSDNESESSEYGSGVKIPFSGSQGSSSSNHTVDIMTCSPKVKDETVPSERVGKIDDSWNQDSRNSTSDSCYTPNTSAFTSDLGSSGGFSSVDLSLDSSDTLGQSSNCDNSFRTPCSSGQHFDESCKRALQPITPTKPTDGDFQNGPLTPTANLKMLLSAASPEIRNMENKKKKARLFEGLVEVASQGAVPPSIGSDASTGENVTQLGLLNSSQEESGVDDSEKANNRKSKSLGLLCQKFLTKYPDYPEDGKAMDISLDQISKDLNVERRRIYDIVNVLESVEMVSRRAKNRYLWHGRTRIHSTLAKLKCLGQRQRFAEQLAHLHRLDEGYLLSDENVSPTFSDDRMYPTLAKLPFQDLSNIQVPLKSPTEAEMRRDGQENWEDDTKKDKTLGVMSQKFIMLFLVCKDRVISLDVAARILKGDQNYQMGESAKFKTKVRRLYDIANILTSLKLIDKIHLSEGRGRKPAFRWIGPDPDTSHVDLSELPSGSKPTQKHSYFPLPPVTAEAWSSHPTHKQTSAMKKLPLGKLGPGKSRLNWSRNASFSAICEVAEQERRKYSSAPNSPVKVEKEEEGQEAGGSSPSLENSGKKKERAFLKEFEALRNKYPSCVSRLFSACGGAPEQPTASPTSSPVDHLVHQSPTDCRVPRLTHMEVTSPGALGAQTGSGGVGKPQKVVYVQRFVPLLNANTIAAVQASTVAQSTSQTTASSTIVAGHRTTVVTNPALVSSQSPVMLQTAPGSVNHLLPLSNGGWVQLPQANGTVPRNIVNLQHHGNLSSAVKSGEMNGQVAVTTSPPLTTSPGVTIVRRSKRQVKLTMDNEYEYQPLVKKLKVEETDTSNSQTADGEPCNEEPIRKPTVVVTHQVALSSASAPPPHPKPDTQHTALPTSATDGNTGSQE
ncbi:uncharacterized protein [Diadema antillarum]|uniref:uncharacterized protein n=1 Tax=Diadema antillarum TaxID=105358 RepID=UPI003A8A2C21